MFKRTLLALALSSLTLSATAHQLWLERDAKNGPVRVFVGDADGEHDRGEEVAKLADTSKVFLTDPAQAAKLSFKEDHLEAAIGAGDVRLSNDQVWKPWAGKDGVQTVAIFNARAGNSETRAALDFEFVPTVANGSTFTLTFRGQPAAGKKVTVVNPGKWAKGFTTDAQGRIAVPAKDKGRYILIAAHSVNEEREIGGQKVAKLDYTATLSFTAK